jgi:hypothetical protein
MSVATRYLRTPTPADARNPVSTSALSPSTWRRFRTTVTAGLLVAATVAGVAVGLQGAAVSPVAPAPVLAAATTQVPNDPHGPHAHRAHR